MNLSKKAVATYIIAISLTSILLALLLLGILGSIYSEENPICEGIDFEINAPCLLDNQISLKVTNFAQTPLEFLVNDANKQELVSKEIKVFNFNIQSEKVIKFSPIITIKENIVSCKSKIKIIDIESISNRCN
ncbi:MAG: hypothetical protein HRU03_02385 [Nanoarchaeales archaeon]|nr:hypothetical protein [Nanoarchaeales archaeon]